MNDEPDEDRMEARRRHNREVDAVIAELADEARHGGERRGPRFDLAPAPEMTRVSAAKIERLIAEAKTQRDRDYLESRWDEVWGR